MATSPGKIFFDVFFTTFYLPEARLRKRSWKLDNSLARRHISPRFGSMKLAAIRSASIEAWLSDLKDSGLAASSCNRVLALLKSVFALAEKYGFLKPGSSPCRSVRSLPQNSRLQRFLSVAEGTNLLAFLERLGSPQAKALQLLLLTGARKNEILKARWQDVDLERHVLTVPLAKSGRQRYIYLSDEAVQLFQSLPGQGEWVFPGRKPGRPISDIYHFWKGIRQQLGLGNVRIHDLRHTFASYLVASGHSLYEAQHLLGHSDPRITMRYAHFAQETLIRAAGSVATILAGRDFASQRSASGQAAGIRKRRRKS